MARTRRHRRSSTPGTKLLVMVLAVILAGLAIMEGLSQLLFKSSLSGAQYISWNKQKDESRAHYDVTALKAKMFVTTASPIRQAPSTSSMKMGTLKPRYRVQVTGKIKVGEILWFQIVRFDGRAGYVKASSLSP